MSQTVGLLCHLLALACTPVPDVAAVQAAYQREASGGSKLHDNGLQVLEVKCHDGQKDQFLCEVTFVSLDDENQRLYFDIVSVKRLENKGWELKSGLCKR